MLETAEGEDLLNALGHYELQSSRLGYRSKFAAFP
jgi:hypothetical protein